MRITLLTSSSDPDTMRELKPSTTLQVMTSATSGGAVIYTLGDSEELSADWSFSLSPETQFLGTQINI